MSNYTYGLQGLLNDRLPFSRIFQAISWRYTYEHCYSNATMLGNYSHMYSCSLNLLHAIHKKYLSNDLQLVLKYFPLEVIHFSQLGNCD